MQSVPFPDARVAAVKLRRLVPEVTPTFAPISPADDNRSMKTVDSISLSESVAVVTGAARGIGRAISLKLAELGAQVVMTARNESLLAKVASQISGAGHRAEGFACDVTDLSSVESLNEHLRKRYGRVNILVNNAGISGPSGALHELAPAEWDAILNTNLRGVYYMMRALVPLMIGTGGGHIINISSLAGKNPLPGGVAYSASKWGLNGLSYGAAEELRGHNLRVSVVCPGSVNTEFSPHSNKNAEKMLQPADVAHAVAALVTQAPQSFISEVLLRPTQKP